MGVTDSTRQRRLRVSGSSRCLVLAGALLSACGASEAERASQEFAMRAVPSELGEVELLLEREVEQDGAPAGHVWRIGLEVVGAMEDSPFVTHVGVLVCVDGDRATGSARFSFLRWEPDRCERGAPRLRRVLRTPEQDRAFDAPVNQSTPLDDDDAIMRAGAEG
jgi:hypothetical protein